MSTDTYCFNLITIRKALDIQEKYPFGEMVFFILDDSKTEILSLVETTREKFKEGHKPQKNEYFLNMHRDTGDWKIDYNLEPVEILMRLWQS